MLEQWLKPRKLLPIMINRTENLLNIRQFLKNIKSPEDLDSEANAHTGIIKDQDAEETTDPEGPEYHEVLGAGSRDEGNTQKT